MHFDIFSLFPQMFAGVFGESIIGRAQQAGHIAIATHDIRDYAEGKHRTTDDTPYGGGGGMVMKPEPIVQAVETVLGAEVGRADSVPIILLSPQGRLLTQSVVEELALHKRLAIICGRYEGVDERVRLQLTPDEISVGDYVLSGGEIAAMVLVDAVTRFLPGVLGDPQAAIQDSHATGLLEHPHYTRPPDYRGLRMPDVLLSGHHAEIIRWRRRESLRRTWQRRPDLLSHADLTPEDEACLLELGSSPSTQVAAKSD